MADQRGAKDGEPRVCSSPGQGPQSDIPQSSSQDLPVSIMKHGAGKQLSSMTHEEPSGDVSRGFLSLEFMERDGDETSQETDSEETNSDNSSDQDYTESDEEEDGEEGRAERGDEEEGEEEVDIVGMSRCSLSG